VLLDVRTKRVLAAAGTPQLASPGSTIKPFVVWALLRGGKIRADESYPCAGALTLAGRSFHCSHPPMAEPMTIATALAYSCNCFVAHFAERFAPGELATELQRAGFRNVRRARQQLQALGEDGVLATPMELAMAYRTLALAGIQPILEGLEGAVTFGTAQRASVPGMRVAGKTGSVRTAAGARVAWFAGFAPSRDPRLVVAVMAPGLSGGAEAAPIAARLLESR
jgi:cell division protein FtsI/penicillin-binding protein 2